jgi:uncharacterized membrane protein YoaK (UPF0700 family)
MASIHPPRLTRGPQALLSFVAGYVDSCTFLALFGLFVAQVTGSFVVAGAQIVARDHEVLAKVLAIPAFLVAGMVTTLLVVATGRGRAAVTTCLALEAALLAGFLASGLIGAPLRDLSQPAALVASLCGIAAMGVQSAMVRLLAAGGGSTNVMTTNTTQIAIDIAEMIIGGLARRRERADQAATDQFAAARGRFARHWPLIAGFLVGSLAGALAFAAVGLLSMGLPIALVLGLVLWAASNP